MQDAKLTENTTGMFDLEIDSGSKKYVSVDGFETSVTTSLFTDARAPSSRVNDAGRRRGTISDILLADINRSIGSILWTFDQSRITQDIINQIRVAAEQAFIWMVDAGVVLGVSAEVSEVDRGLNITLLFRGTDNIIRRYQRLWRLSYVA